MAIGTWKILIILPDYSKKCAIVEIYSTCTVSPEIDFLDDSGEITYHYARIPDLPQLSVPPDLYFQDFVGFTDLQKRYCSETDDAYFFFSLQTLVNADLLPSSMQELDFETYFSSFDINNDGEMTIGEGYFESVNSIGVDTIKVYIGLYHLDASLDSPTYIVTLILQIHDYDCRPDVSTTLSMIESYLEDEGISNMEVVSQSFAERVDISAILENLERTSLTCAVSYTGQFFSRIKFTGLYDTDDLTTNWISTAQTNTDWVDLGSEENTENDSKCYPLWLSQEDNVLIFNANSQCTHMGLYTYMIEIVPFSGMPGEALV